MKNKNAFTLMELLAVLVIMAIIALIVFPIIGDVITDSKMKAFKSSVDGLEHAVDVDYQKDYYTGVREYSYADGNLVLNSVKGESRNNNIKVEGIIENGVGTISVDKDGNTLLIIYNNEYCAVKDYEDKTITVEEKTDGECLIKRTFTEIMQPLIGTEVNNNDPDGNLRYVGSDPDNYVWFNKDAEGNKERWRIIGVFNGQTKIIKDEYCSTSAIWDSKGLNNWATAFLQLALNNTTDGYITTIQANDPISYSYIDLEYVWNIGSVPDSYNQTRLDLYNVERSETPAGAEGSEATWTGAIGLMYPSDYGYSTNGDQSICDSTDMYSWNTEPAFAECAEKSWLYDSSQTQWTLIPFSDNSFAVFGVYSAGYVGGDYASEYNAARPVLYLKSNTKIVGGQGTFDQPFELAQ